MPFEDLSAEQKDFIAQLVEMLETGLYESDLHFFGTFTGWTVLLSGKPGQEGVELESLSETQLQFIESAGYLFLVSQGNAQYTGMLTPKAAQEYRKLKKRSLTKQADKLASALEEMRQEFVDEVLIHFEKSDRARGDASFSRWEDRLIATLESLLPGEVANYQGAMKKGPFTSKLLGVSEQSHFMKNRGDKVLGFLDSLIDDIRRGRLDGIAVSVVDEPRPISSPEEDAVSAIPPVVEAPDTRNVFVVHGRNQEIRNSVFAFLRSINLNPIEWTEAVQHTGKGTPYVGEILDSVFTQAQAIVVVFTPDDEARLRSKFLTASDPDFESNLTGQARPNVIFESGLAFGQDPDRTILVEVGNLRPFSDIAGRHVVRLTNDVERRQALAMRLQVAGCDVSLDGVDWHTVGDFSIEDELLAPMETKPDESTQEADSEVKISIRREIQTSSYISSDHKNFQRIHSDFIGSDRCTILLWVLIPEIGHGLRHSPHNRYLLAHATQDEDEQEFNLFALRHSIDKWQFCYSNSKGERNCLSIEDGLDIGWHQFTVAWNRYIPDLIFAIDRGDGGRDISRSFLPYWPSRLADTVSIGAWISPYEESYCDTKLSHLWIVGSFIETTHPLIDEHLKLKPY